MGELQLGQIYPDISTLPGYRERTSPGYARSALTWELAEFLCDVAKREAIRLPSQDPHDMSRFLFESAENSWLDWNSLRRDFDKARSVADASGQDLDHYFGREYVLSSANSCEHHRLVLRNIVKYLLYYVQDRRCIGCGTEFPLSRITIDHIEPRSKMPKDGSANRSSNIQLMCEPCNGVKADS